MSVTVARSLSRSKPAEGAAFCERAPWWGGDLQTLAAPAFDDGNALVSDLGRDW